MNIVMVSGGVRSGKSAYAERLVLERSSAAPAKVLYVATGLRWDGEMDERIDKHLARRPAEWDTLEAASDLSVSPYEDYDFVLVDTLSAWIANRLMEIPEERLGDKSLAQRILTRVDEYIEALGASRLREAVIVTDEVGWGGVALSPLGRRFQDIVGEANQRLAARADEAVVVVSGLPWRLKG